MNIVPDVSVARRFEVQTGDSRCGLTQGNEALLCQKN